MPAPVSPATIWLKTLRVNQPGLRYRLGVDAVMACHLGFRVSPRRLARFESIALTKEQLTPPGGACQEHCSRFRNCSRPGPVGPATTVTTRSRPATQNVRYSTSPDDGEHRS